MLEVVLKSEECHTRFLANDWRKMLLAKHIEVTPVFSVPNICMELSLLC